MLSDVIHSCMYAAGRMSPSVCDPLNRLIGDLNFLSLIFSTRTSFIAPPHVIVHQFSSLRAYEARPTQATFWERVMFNRCLFPYFPGVMKRTKQTRSLVEKSAFYPQVYHLFRVCGASWSHVKLKIQSMRLLMLVLISHMPKQDCFFLLGDIRSDGLYPPREPSNVFWSKPDSQNLLNRLNIRHTGS